MSESALKPVPRAALVSGAGQRIGRAIALDLAAQGWAVAVHYNRSAAEAEDVAETIRRAGGRAVVLGADLRRESEVETLIPRAAEALGTLGLLVNNASVFEMETWDTVTRQSWDDHLEVNLRAPFVLMQAFARRLPEDTQGCIVNMLDERVWNLTPYFTSYTVAKMGLWALTQTLALGMAPRIRVNGIGPGPALPSAHQTDEQFRRQCRSMPLGRGTSPDEICRAVRFILEAPSMTGQMIALDGGQHLAWSHAARAPTPDE